jgi:hypothetical protein
LPGFRADATRISPETGNARYTLHTANRGRENGVRDFAGKFRLLIVALAAGAVGVVVYAQRTRLGISTGVPPAGPAEKYEPFQEPPPATAGGSAQLLPPGGDTRRSEVSPGTQGRPLPAPPIRARIRLAILGPLEPGNPAGLAKVVGELSELSPDLVLTTGDMVRGFAESPEMYAEDAAAARGALNKLTVPWYPCVGRREVAAGTLDPKDDRLAPLYARYFGPRYYSIDIGDTHIIVLDSEENPWGPATFSDEQLIWLRKDLDRTFRRVRHVVVVLHRPAWREKESNWARIHQAFVAFNRRPIVQIEGAGEEGGIGGGQVEAVFAGGAAYTQDETRDGISEYVIGPAAGSGAAVTGQMAQYAIVQAGSGAGRVPKVSVAEVGHLFGGKLVTAETAAELATLADPGNVVLEGTLEQPAEQASGSLTPAESKLTLIARNPTKTALTVRVRLADAAGGWQLGADTERLRLSPGQELRQRVTLYCPRQNRDLPPPELELALRTEEPAAREVVLRRVVPLVPSAEVPRFAKVNAAAWEATPWHELWGFSPRSDGAADALEVGPEDEAPARRFRMAADAEKLYLRVHVEGVRGAYVAQTDTPWALPMDAVTLAWADGRAAGATVQRVVVLPFAPSGQQLLTNTGVGMKQTALTLLDTKACPATVRVTLSPRGYELELSLPRELVFPSGRAAAVNVGAFLAERGRESRLMTWAAEEGGPAAWGTAALADAPATRAATLPAVPATRP